MAQRYKVTAAYVTCKTETDQGPMIVGLYAGSWVPQDATGVWIDHHLANNLIAVVPGTEDPAPEPVKPEPKAEPVKAESKASAGARATARALAEE